MARQLELWTAKLAVIGGVAIVADAFGFLDRSWTVGVLQTATGAVAGLLGNAAQSIRDLGVSSMIQIDPLAGLLAVIAIWFAWRVEVRNTTACAKLIECNGTSAMSVDENNVDMFHIFKIRVKNLGIPLHNPTAALLYWVDDEKGSGTLSTKMSRVRTTSPSGHAELSKGMVAEFELKSYQLRDWIPQLLRLTDPAKQKARIVVSSQGFEAVTLPITTRFEGLRDFWNRWASRINQRFWRQRVNKAGEVKFDTRNILPTFARNGLELSSFIEGIRRDQERGETINWAKMSARAPN